jgi:DNA (cytosine-5)-methyltransferase 1
MNHASLFSGIGGFDLAAEWAGWNNIFHCEWNPFGQRVLAHHFPNSKSYNDIIKTNFSVHAGQIDVLTGGFPCQPYSTAGLRKGKADERHLFPEMLRAIKEIKPKWVIGENVRGLVNWGGGMVFDEVCNDLESEGYEVQPFLIPAASVNAPHQRQRIWFIAYANDKGGSTRSRQVQSENGKISEWNDNAESCDTSYGVITNPIGLRLEHIKEGGNIYNSTSKTQRERSESSKPFEANGNNGDVTNTKSKGLFGLHKTGYENNINRQNTKIWGGTSRYSKENNFINFPTQSPICGGNDGLPRELDGITFPKWRKESIKGFGNAIVPQVAYEIFKTIITFEEQLKNQ